jgi:hypothetical protein
VGVRSLERKDELWLVLVRPPEIFYVVLDHLRKKMLMMFYRIFINTLVIIY